MKRRILLVDDEVAVLLTMKAVLEISGFEVDTAASAREGMSRVHTHEYDMVITDMRMESDQAGRDVVQAARAAAYHPAVALLTAFPVDEADWQQLGAHQLLLKPMHTRILLQQIEKLFEARERRLASLTAPTQASAKQPAKAKPVAKKISAVKKKPAKKAVKAAKSAKPIKKAVVEGKKTVAKKVVAKKAAAKKTVPKSRSKAKR